MTVEVKLLRPLDGKEIGETASYPEADAIRLEGCGAVKILKAKAAPGSENKMSRGGQNKARAGKGS